MFASSNHAVGFYPRARRIGIDDHVRPDSRYGVSKAFGEALGALYAFKHGLRVTCIRIGNFGDAPVDRRRLSIWIKPEDLVQLVRIGLEHPDIRYEVFFGASDNARGWWDNAEAFRYGYRPQGRSEDFRDSALAADAKLPPDRIGDWYEGGPYCSDEYDGDEELSPSLNPPHENLILRSLSSLAMTSVSNHGPLAQTRHPTGHPRPSRRSAPAGRAPQDEGGADH